MAEIGKIEVDVELVNLLDAMKVIEKTAQAGSERRAKIRGLIDTGATQLSIPEEVATALGVPVRKETEVRLADGTLRKFKVVRGIEVTINGRSIEAEALVTPSGTKCLVGQTVLEGMDWHIDPKGQRLIPNPESPDHPLLDML